MIDPYRTDEDVTRLADETYADLTGEHRILFRARWDALDVELGQTPEVVLSPRHVLAP